MMSDPVTLRWAAGQLFGLIALALCVRGFASKRDDRLFVLLLVANVAFSLQFVMFRSWVAAAIAALIVIRIHLVRRCKGHAVVMGGGTGRDLLGRCTDMDRAARYLGAGRRPGGHLWHVHAHRHRHALATGGGRILLGGQQPAGGVIRRDVGRSADSADESRHHCSSASRPVVGLKRSKPLRTHAQELWITPWVNPRNASADSALGCMIENRPVRPGETPPRMLGANAL